MSDFQVIPAIDIIDGKCVRLYQGDYNQKTVYADDPVAVAKKWQDCGAKRLHVVDLDGAKAGQPVNLAVASRICQETDLICDWGGGIREPAHIQQALDAGFRYFSIGTKALDADFSRSVFSDYSEQAILDIAARDGKVAIHGWQEQLTTDAYELAAKMAVLGCQRVIFTDISRDGALTGPNIEAMRKMAVVSGLSVIASGGVSSIEDILSLSSLATDGVEGVITGKALYDGRVDLRLAISLVV